VDSTESITNPSLDSADSIIASEVLAAVGNSDVK